MASVKELAGPIPPAAMKESMPGDMTDGLLMDGFFIRREPLTPIIKLDDFNARRGLARRFKRGPLNCQNTGCERALAPDDHLVCAPCAAQIEYLKGGKL
jgi:hypothetical protein